MKEILELVTVTPVKSNIEKESIQIIQDVKDGLLAPIETLIKLKFISEVVNKAIKEISEDCLTEMANEKQRTLLGATIDVREVGAKFNYAQCPSWICIKEKIKPLEENLKKIEEQIKMATKIGKHITDEETGETISPVAKESTTSVVITLGK